LIIKATDDFTKWASGYSGCNGDVTGNIWFCGIEYGGNEAENEFQFTDASNPADIPDDFFKYQYNIKVAKIYATLRGEAVENYSTVALRDNLFVHNSGVFKMNLYPISFHHDTDDLWPEWIYRKTGLPTKSIYRAWCQIYRFSEILKWVNKHSPKIIICTGITYQNDFIMAFNGLEDLYKKDISKKTISGRDLVALNVNDDKTILVIIPFLGGTHGLNSDQLLQVFGKEIQNLCNSKFGNNCFSLLT
jgi:hypothetical protein